MFTFLENEINIYDKSIIWADLYPEFPGYQISNTGLVRSFKFNSNFGILIFPKKGFYTLSNSTNNRVKVTIDELLELGKKHGFTYLSCIASAAPFRNPVCCSKSDYKKKQNERQNNKDKIIFPKFTIIDK